MKGYDKTRKKEAFFRRVIAFVESSGWSKHKAMSYSGRGMYGQRCLAVITDNQNELYAEVGDEFKSSRDYLGYRTVVYWQTVPWFEDIATELGIEEEKEEE